MANNPFYNKTKPAIRNSRKGAVMFDENYQGIIQSLPVSSVYYNTENNSTYYDGYYFDDVSNLGSKFHVNYLKKH